MEPYKIQIQHFDCPKQEVAEIKESFIELTDQYIRYRVHAYIFQWNESMHMLKEEAAYINDDEIFLRNAFRGVYFTTGYSDGDEGTEKFSTFIVKVYFDGYDSCIWVRFKKENEARSVMNKILEWGGINIGK